MNVQVTVVEGTSYTLVIIAALGVSEHSVCGRKPAECTGLRPC